MKRLSLVLFLAAAIVACQNNAPKKGSAEKTVDQPPAGLMEKAKGVFKVPSKVAENPDNPVTDAKVALGKVLYFDNRLSKGQTQSCNTCHNLATFGVDNNSFSKGDAGGLGGRNSPTTIYSGHNFVQFWDGRSPDVEDQAGGPVLNPVEMAMPSEDAVTERLNGIKGYADLFKAAFPGDADAVTFKNMQKAIGAFERTLNPVSKFDNYLNGDETALNDQEKAGLQTFMDAGCATCHNGALLGGGMYQKFGIFGNYWELTGSAKIDSGRYVVTGKDADLFVFKVPMLRNVEGTYPYFHDGSVKELPEAVKIMGKTELNKELTDEEVNRIVTFLKTLTAPVSEEVATAPAMP